MKSNKYLEETIDEIVALYLNRHTDPTANEIETVITKLYDKGYEKGRFDQYRDLNG